jgi:hypothetical protein
MTLDEIKQAVDAGKTVHWSNAGYTVIKDRNGAYFIRFHDGNSIGLTWQDGVTLNGKPEEFFVAFDEDAERVCIVDGLRGIYVGQHFARMYGDNWSGISPTDLAIVRHGPGHHEYDEAWANVLRDAEMQDDQHRTWKLEQDNDLFMVLQDSNVPSEAHKNAVVAACIPLNEYELPNLQALLDAVRAGCPEYIGSGPEGKKHFDAGWNAAMRSVYNAMAATLRAVEEISK